MNFVAAKCPSCQGQLQIPDDRDFVKCMYCSCDIKVREVIHINSDYSNQINFWRIEANNLLQKADEEWNNNFSNYNNSEKIELYSKAYELFEKILVINPDDEEANFVKIKKNLLSFNRVNKSPYVLIEENSDFQKIYFADKISDIFQYCEPQDKFLNVKVTKECMNLIEDSIFRIKKLLQSNQKEIYATRIEDFLIDEIMMNYHTIERLDQNQNIYEDIWLLTKPNYTPKGNLSIYDNALENFAFYYYQNFYLSKIAGRIGYLELFQEVIGSEKLKNYIVYLCELALSTRYYQNSKKGVFGKKFECKEIPYAERVYKTFHSYLLKYKPSNL